MSDGLRLPRIALGAAIGSIGGLLAAFVASGCGAPWWLALMLSVGGLACAPVAFAVPPGEIAESLVEDA